MFVCSFNATIICFVLTNVARTTAVLTNFFPFLCSDNHKFDCETLQSRFLSLSKRRFHIQSHGNMQLLVGHYNASFLM